MKSGGKLSVTLNHPLVDGEGYMKKAEEFKIGDKLVLANGKKDKIVQINVVDFFGKVYNVAPKSNNSQENIVVAKGYLNGSHKFQTGEVTDYMRYSERKDIPENLYK